MASSSNRSRPSTRTGTPTATRGRTSTDGSLHVDVAVACAALGAAAGVVAARVDRMWLRVLTRPVAVIVATYIVVVSTSRFALGPLGVALAGVLGAAASMPVARRSLATSTTSIGWLCLATIAWLAYWSLPDTEGTIATAGVALPIALGALVAPQRPSAVELGAGLAAGSALLAISIALGGTARYDWTSWWVPKIAGVAVAAVLSAAAIARDRRPS